MGLFDDIQNKPELPDENELLQSRGEPLEAPEVEPETPEEAMLVARASRAKIEEDEGMEFGTPVDFAEQFNNTVIAAAGAPVDLLTWSLNGASKILGGPRLIDPETAVGGSANIKSALNPVGIGSDEEADSYLGYAGNTFGEAAAFLAGGAAVVQKTKQAGGVIGSISKSADKALRTKLDDVVAVEATASLGMAAGRQYAEENEMGATGSLLLEFTTGALAMVSGAGAKKVILDPLTAKLKNMKPTEALEKLSKEEIAEVVARGREEKAKVEPKAEAPKEAPEPAAEPTPAPKTPEADPTSASGDAIDASIAAVKGILEGDRTGGKGARVTREAKKHFRAVAKEFFDDINQLGKTKDVAVAKKILSRIDKYIDFDRVISKKDYAQGSELQANTRQAMDNGTTDYAAGITAAGNKRTEDLKVLKGMLQKLVDEDVAVDPKLAKKVADDAKKRAEGAPKLSKEEKLDAIADQVAKTFVEERGGVFQQAIDGYFTVRLTQMLNQAKTAFVGVPSATFMSVVRPLINTPYNIAKAAGMKGQTVSRRVQYAAADVTATYEYVRMMTKHLKDTLRSAKDTILNKGDSNFLYRDRNAYIRDQLAEASEPTHTVKRRMKQAQRRVAAQEAKTETGRKLLTAKATVMNSKLAQVPAFFFDYGVSLIGGLEEISLIAHSMRAARAQGIKKGINEGVDDVWKFSEDYMESAFDRSRGGLQAKYDPEYADIFNQARRDHFRAMDLEPNDIRKDMVDGLIAGLNKVSTNHDEMGYLARTLFVFIGVPMRALGANLSFIASPLNVAKNVAGGGARRLEQALGGTATFGKYNSKISELELDIKGQKKLLKSEDPDVKATAEKKLAELEDSLAQTKDLKMQKDYEDLGKLAIGSGLFFLGYEMAKNGQVAGTDSWMTEEQKFATQKVQGAPNSWKIVLGGSEYDFKYFEPLKGVFALGADYARRQAAEDAGALTDDQTITQFLTSVTKSIATDSPFATGARYMTQIMSPNPETQERGVLGVVRSLVPVPAEVRNFNKFDEELVTDTTSGEFFDTVMSASLGQETGNYRLTSLGEPKLKEEPSLLSYMIPFGPKAVPEREPIDDILLEDAMSFRSVSAPQTSISGFKLKNYTNEDNETLYSLYGRLITETRIDGKTQRQALNKLVKTADFKKAYDNNKYTMDDKGAEVNEGIEMIKDVISEYRAEARRKILETKAAADYLDGDDNNIYDILKEREAFDEQPESLLETLNLK